MKIIILTTISLLITYLFIGFIVRTFHKHKWYFYKKGTAGCSPSEAKYNQERGCNGDYLPWYTTTYKCSKCKCKKVVYRQAFTHLGRSPKEIEII